MPIYRGPDGKIIEERTRKIDGESVTRHSPQQPAAPAQADADRTCKLNEPAPGRPSPATTGADAVIAGNDVRTRYLNPKGAIASGPELNNPVVGWIAVIAGPGTGSTLPLGYGANSIGRGPGNRVNLDFGDEQISRSQHTVLTYDPRGRRFYLQPGGGAALTYIDDQPLLIPREITRGAKLVLGSTTLYLQPLCGTDFDWQDLGN